MFELTINEQVYQFNPGMRFLRNINQTAYRRYDNGMQEEAGLAKAVASLIDGNLDALVDMLFMANEGQSPRVTKMLLDSYIEDAATDIDALVEEWLDFLKQSNATKKIVAPMMEAVARAKEQKEGS